MLWAHCQHGMMQTIGSAARNIITDTLVSGQAQQIFLGFVLGLSDAVADSGISRLSWSSGKEQQHKRAAKHALCIPGREHADVRRLQSAPDLLCMHA